MNDFELNRRPQLPIWMKITHASDFPKKWLFITETFLKMADLLLLSRPPESAFVNFSEFKGHLLIEFNARPLLTKRQAIVIDRAMTIYKKLARSMQTDDQLSLDTQDLFDMQSFKVQESMPKNASSQNLKSVCQEVSGDGFCEKQIAVFNNFLNP
jgi:hypothetical protein